MRNLCALLDYVPITTYIIINWKFLCIPIIHIYKLVQFHISRHFRTSPSVRVSDSGQPVKCSIKYIKNKPYHKIHRCIPARSTFYYTLLHTSMSSHTKKNFMPACHLHDKISPKTKMSHSPLLYTHTLHTSSSTSKYD